MQTIEEYKAYTQQLEGEVGKWHHAYDALIVERNQLVNKLKSTEKFLKAEREECDRWRQRAAELTKQTQKGRIKMQIQFKDVKEILNKVKSGGNYTPLEIELAKMAYRYRCKIAEMAESKALMFDSLFSAYSAMQNSPFGADLLHRMAATLASQSKAHTAQAVKMDNQLKELINDGTGESKDSGRDCEA